MKDGFDNLTTEMKLEVKKPRGRPGKIITDDNFFSVLTYFAKKRYLDLKQQASIKAIQLAAPPAKQTSNFLISKIKANEAYLKELIERRESYGSNPMDMLSPKEVFLARSDADIALAKERLKGLHAQGQAKPSIENVHSLQQWVNLYVDKDDWTRCLNLESQKKSSKKAVKKKISIAHTQYVELAALKKDLGVATWEQALQKMAVLTRQALSQNK